MTRIHASLGTQDIGGADLGDLLEGLGIQHEDGILVGTHHIQFLSIDDGIVGRTTETSTVSRLVHILLNGIVSQVDKTHTAIDTIVRTAVVDHNHTLGNGDIDRVVFLVVVTQTACEKGCTHHQGYIKEFLFHRFYKVFKVDISLIRASSARAWGRSARFHTVC